MLKRLSFLLVFLLFLSFLGEAFHHHDDCGDHPDCAVCVAVVHHKADTGLTTVSSEVQLELTGTVSVLPYLPVVSRVSFTPSNNRAPPV